MTGRLNGEFDIWWFFPTDLTNDLYLENEYF